MRLIDADALNKNADELIAQKGFTVDHEGGDTDFVLTSDDVRELITNAPTVQLEGWVSVPIELNRKQKQAMIWAYEEAMGGARLPDGDAYDETIVQKMHEAMLSAAPTDTE